jgi:hypothetical protein
LIGIPSAVIASAVRARLAHAAAGLETIVKPNAAAALRRSIVLRLIVSSSSFRQNSIS